jgi:hypothetical protein
MASKLTFERSPLSGRPLRKGQLALVPSSGLGPRALPPTNRSHVHSHPSLVEVGRLRWTWYKVNSKWGGNDQCLDGKFMLQLQLVFASWPGRTSHRVPISFISIYVCRHRSRNPVPLCLFFPPLTFLAPPWISSIECLPPLLVFSFQRYPTKRPSDHHFFLYSGSAAKTGSGPTGEHMEHYEQQRM